MIKPTNLLAIFIRSHAAALLTATALLASLPSALAQRVGTGPASQPGVRWNADVTWSARASLSDGQARGDIGLTQTRLGGASRIALGSEMGVTLGAELTWLTLDSSQDQGLPDQLHGHAAVVDFDYTMSPSWRLLLRSRPGVYADTATLNGDTFNAPIVLAASYVVDRTLAWQFGLRYDAFSDYELLPLVGVRWQFQPEWTLNIGFPRSGIFWQYSPDLTLDWHVGMLGGNYRTTRNYRPQGTAFARSTADTYLDVREIRTGLGADWQFAGGMRLRLEAGLASDRKFEYFDRDINLDGKSAAYVTVSVNGRF